MVPGEWSSTRPGSLIWKLTIHKCGIHSQMSWPQDACEISHRHVWFPAGFWNSHKNMKKISRYPPVIKHDVRENGPCIGDLPSTTLLYKGFSIAMFDYQRVLQKRTTFQKHGQFRFLPWDDEAPPAHLVDRALNYELSEVTRASIRSWRYWPS